MFSFNVRVFIFLFTFSFLVSSGQELVKPAPPPGNLKILEGYSWTPKISKDSLGGQIDRKDGFSIFFTKSGVNGFYSRIFENKTDLTWVKQQVVNGQQLDIGLFKNGELVAMLDGTTLFKARASSMDEVTDFLLTIMTFESGKGRTLNEHSDSIPGDIKLLADYVHKPLTGIDSRPGTIKRGDGFSINYDIGRMAGTYAEEYFPEHLERLRKQTHLNAHAIEGQIQFLQNQVEWRKRQKVNGDDVRIVLLKDSKLIASFVTSTANFIAKVDSRDKLADFLLTVLTYQPSPKANAK